MHNTTHNYSKNQFFYVLLRNFIILSSYMHFTTISACIEYYVLLYVTMMTYCLEKEENKDLCCYWKKHRKKNIK